MPTNKLFQILSWLLILSLVSLAPQALATHGGPVFYVDANNAIADDFDGDYHFHSLGAALQQFPNPKEGDTLLIAPGQYRESLTIDVEGLIVKGTRMAGQTVIEGALVVASKRVQLSNFTVDATGKEHGVELRADKISLEDLTIFGARNGVFIDGQVPLKDFLLNRNHIYHNQVGILGTNFRYSAFNDNVIEANTEFGGLFAGVYNVTLANNQWSSNDGVGLSITDGRRLQLNDEIFFGNGDHGAVFVEVSQMKVKRATFDQNGATGAQLDDVRDSGIRDTMFADNRQAGLRLQNKSQSNRIDNNSFTRHSDQGASGLWLMGGVYDNELFNNTFSDNHVGVLLSAVKRTSPGSNRFEQNEITNSGDDGLRVEASEGDNVFFNNRFIGNNGNGVYLAGRNDDFSDNHIERSGGAGLWLAGAENLRLQNNVVLANQGAGIQLTAQARNNYLAGNLIQRNHREGVVFEHSRDSELLDNVISENHLHGVRIAQSGQITLHGNHIERNGAAGLWLEQVSGFDASHNTIEHNQLGGIAIQRSNDVDLSGNAIVANLHTGLRVEGSEVTARRNWWGDPLGPAGAFEGRGNAVLGVDLERILPWLPDEPQTQNLSSISATLLDAVGPGKTLEIDLQERMGLTLKLARIGVDDEGKRMPISLGVVLLSQYLLTAADFETPANTLALYSVQVGGFQHGAAQLIVRYEGLPEGIDPQALKLWVRIDSGWAMLPGSVRENARQVSGELQAHSLKPGLIALAPESAFVSSLNAENVSDTTLLEADQDGLVSPLSSSDLPLLGASLILLGLGRVILRQRSLRKT